MARRARLPLRDALQRAARVLGWCCVFSLCALLGLVLHANVPALRAAAAAAVNRSLEGQFRGRWVLGSLDHLGAAHASLSRLELLDERGASVLELEGVQLGYHPWQWIAPLLFGADAPLRLEHLRVERSRIALASDPETGKWTLQRALEGVRPPSQRPKRPALRYALAAIELGELALSVQHPSVGHLDANLQHLQASADIAGDETSVNVQRFGLRLVAADDVPIDGTGSLRVLPHGTVAATFHGFVDATEIDAAASLDSPAASAGQAAGNELKLRLDVPRARPEQLRKRWPAWPLESDASLHLAARGPAQALQVQADLNALASRIAATGEVELSNQPKARLALDAHALDARLFWATAPATELGARAQLQLERGSVGLVADVTGTSEPTRIGELPLPGSKFALQLRGSALDASLELGDARGRVQAKLGRTGSGATHVELKASGVELESWPELQGRVRGRADLVAQAELSEGRVSGSVRGKLVRIAAAGVGAAQASVESHFEGPVSDWSALTLQTSLSAQQLSLGPLGFPSAQWTSRGSLQQASFDATLHTAAGGNSRVRGKLELADVLRLRDLDATWSERDLELTTTVSYLSPAERSLRVTRLQISGGVGKLQGSGRIEAGTVDVNLDADALDTGRLSRLFGAARQGLGGRITGHAALSTDGATRGNIDLQIAQFTLREFALGTLGVRATLQDRRLVASAENSESPLGRLEARVTAALDGAVLESRSWTRATGEGSLTLKQLPLWPIGLALPKQGPVRDLGGQLDLALQLERSEATALPSAFLQASTRELSFSVVSEAGGKREPSTFDQFTLHASGSLDGPSGHGSASLLLTDPRGTLVSTSGAVELDLARLLANPRGALEQLLHAPLDALLRLHARPLSQLPVPLPIRDLAGSIEGNLQLSGSLSEPVLDLELSGHDLLGAGSGQEPLELSGLVHFVPDGGALVGRAEATRAGKSLVNARLAGRMRRADEATASGAEPLAAWTPSELSAAAMLNGVPLALWPAAAREHAEALLYGSVSYEQRGAESSQRAQIEIAGLSIQNRLLGNGRLTLASDASGSQAELQIGPEDHRLRARLHGAPAGPEQPNPGLDGSVTAQNFEVASLSPLVSGILSHLGGELNADASVELRRSPQQGWYLGINGQAELHDASARLDLFGLDLRELDARIQARSTPQYTVLLIDPMQAKARSRRSNVQGDAELWLEGVRLVSGEASLSLNDVPVSLKSATRGTLRARLRGQLERQSDYMGVKVTVPEFRLQLPAASTRSLIALEANPDIHISEAAETAPATQSEALLWKLAFELGGGVRVERADLSLPLSGTPSLDYRDEVRPSGSIQVRSGGRITLFDQNFNIDHGVLQFDPDAPDNPRVDATASWRAPDGTSIYVDITGRANEASVLTRDDRGLQDVERFYLLTGNASSSAASSIGVLAEANAGEGALGQTFSLGINQWLRQSVGNVAVSIGTTTDDRASYGASVRLSDRLSFQGSYQPPSETKRDESTTDLKGSLDYQISRRWSLRTELGTTGGAFDLLWSHRY